MCIRDRARDDLWAVIRPGSNPFRQRRVPRGLPDANRSMPGKRMDYPIRAVSKLTGLSVDTLRAWERRYAAVKPGRKDHARLYSEADVARLTLLRDAVRRGHAISQLVPLNNEQLRELTVLPLASGGQTQPSGAGAISLQPDLQSILAAVERFGFAEIDKALSRLATLAPARDLLHQALIPLMLSL